MLKRIHNSLGNKFDNCIEAVVYIAPEYEHILKRHEDKYKNLSRKDGIQYAKINMIKLDNPEDGCLVAFFDKDVFGHVGVYYKGYIYHNENNVGFLGQRKETILQTNKYSSIEYYKNKEV